MYRNKKGFEFSDFEITYHEILASISIFAIMMLLGIIISSKISQSYLDKNEKYNKAIKIEGQEMFVYGMETNIGNAFVYGKLKAVDTVTYPEIGGKYMYVKKIKEKYTMHTRTVTYTTGSGKHRQTHTKTETYWTWDKVGNEDLKSKEVSFCNIVFKIKKIEIPDAEYIKTIKESSHIRYKYYGTSEKYIGTIFTNLKDNTISNKTPFYKNMNIEETIKCLEEKEIFEQVLFWAFWIILTGGVIGVFYYIDNEWLE